MRCIGKIIGITLFCSTSVSNAGFYANTAHSRGNCMGFNESITWNWSEYHWWEVKSVHFRERGSGPITHDITAFMQYTWRCAALDFWADPAGGNADNYWVQGYHFFMNSNGQKIFDVYTQSGNCSGYNGWWDKIKARGDELV